MTRLHRCLRRVRHDRDERGITMVELAMTMTILGIVLATLFTAIYAFSRAVSGTELRTININEGRVLMATASKDLRTATRLVAGSSPFVTADKNTVTFYAYLNTTTAPKRVKIYVDSSTQLVEEVTTADVSSVPPNYTYTGIPSVRFVGRYVANPASQPIFDYFDSSGAQLTATPLSAADALKVRQVKITLSIRKSTNLTVASTTIINRVRLANVDYTAVLEGS